MLPDVTLNKVSREDVDRIAGWLQDGKVASRWFGRNAYGDPEPRHYDDSRRGSIPVITIAGLPGSGSESLGAEIARITGSRLVVDEIPEMVSRRLRRSIGELDALKASRRSVWTRMLRNVAAHWEQYGSMDDSYLLFYPRMNIDPDEPLGYLTKEEFLEGFRGVVTELALEGSVVLCGIGTNLFIPSKVPAFRLLVLSSEASRQQRIARELDLTQPEAAARRAQLDRDTLTVSKHLYGYDLLDVERYDMVLNVDRMTHARTAESIASMLGVRSSTAHRETLTAIR